MIHAERTERSKAAELAQLRDTQQGASLINHAAGASTPITVGNGVLFANAIFNEFRKPGADRDEDRLIRYMDLALKARNMEIRASAVHLNYERFRLEAAKHSHDCAGGSQSGNRRKIEKATLLLFGEKPEGFVSETGLPVAETEKGIAHQLGQAAGEQ